MKRVFAIAFTWCLLIVSMSACTPKGQPCNHKGDTQATGGTVYHCKYDPSAGGNTWQ
jgi:hypothetical protein